MGMISPMRWTDRLIPITVAGVLTLACSAPENVLETDVVKVTYEGTDKVTRIDLSGWNCPSEQRKVWGLVDSEPDYALRPVRQGDMLIQEPNGAFRDVFLRCGEEEAGMVVGVGDTIDDVTINGDGYAIHSEAFPEDHMSIAHQEGIFTRDTYVGLIQTEPICPAGEVTMVALNEYQDSDGQGSYELVDTAWKDDPRLVLPLMQTEMLVGFGCSLTPNQPSEADVAAMMFVSEGMLKRAQYMVLTAQGFRPALENEESST